MDYTPRQLQAFLIIVSHRKQHELAEQLHIGALAAQGDSKAIKDVMRKLTDDAR
jgi:hypothetical protein